MYSIALNVLLVTTDPELCATLPVDLELASQARVRVIVESDLRQGFDAVLVDLGDRGPEWLERARWRSPGTPLVVLLRESDHSRALQCLRTGAQDVLTLREVEGAGAYRALRYAVERCKASRLQVWGVQHQSRAEKMEAVGRLAAGVVHDFRHFVQIVVGNCTLMMRQNPDDEALQERLREVRDAAGRGNQLIDRLLSFAREGGSHKVVNDLSRVLEKGEVLIKPLLGHRIQLRSRCDEGCVFWANETEVEQILMNLVVNAADAMPMGGWLFLEGRVVELTHSLVGPHCRLHPGRYVALSVADTGAGMSPELLEKVVEPFFTTKAQTGTGLGLSSVYSLASGLGGGLLLASEPAVGTCACVLFPAQEAAVPAPPGELRETVLLLDPHEPTRASAREVLQTLGCEVLEARTLEEARRLCGPETSSIGLALVDAAVLLGCGTTLEELLPEARHVLLSDFPQDWQQVRGWRPPGWLSLQRPWGAAQVLELKGSTGAAAAGAAPRGSGSSPRPPGPAS